MEARQVHRWNNRAGICCPEKPLNTTRSADTKLIIKPVVLLVPMTAMRRRERPPQVVPGPEPSLSLLMPLSHPSPRPSGEQCSWYLLIFAMR